MSQQIVINYGAAPNDGTGDPLRTAFIKTDENFDNIWLAGPVGSNVTITNNTISVTDTNGNLVLSPNGIGVIQTNSRLAPLANLTYDIGSSALRYRNIYAAGVTAANAVLGNLSNITVTVANLHVLDGTAGYVLQTDGTGNLTWVANTGVPGGVNTQVQFNNAGSFGAQTGFTFNKTSNLLSVPGNITTTGNITGNYFLGNGSQLTGIAASYGNANVVANLSALGTNPITTTGNITGNYFLGNGSQLTGIAASYGNANVVANLAALGTNPITTTGNITGNYFLGNGSQLTGLAASYGNANVVANLAALGTNPISTTGNITGGNILGGANVNATTHTGTTVSVSANITGGNILTAGIVSATGNITGNYFIGNGRQLTGITGNVTFSGEAVIGTGTSNIQSGLYLAPDPVSLANNLYLRVRGNIQDEPTHIHFDTGNNAYYNQFIGDDNKYIQLANTGNIVVNSNDGAGNSAQWTFGAAGKITFPNGASLNDTSGDSVAFGQNAGLTSQAQHAVAIGINAGRLYQGEDSVAIGYNAGYYDQQRGVAIGWDAGEGGILFKTVSDAQGGSGPVRNYVSGNGNPTLTLDSVVNVNVNDKVFGNNIPGGAYVVSISDPNINISTPPTAALTAGDDITFVGVVIGINNATSIVVGMRVTGTAIPDNTVVQSTGCSVVTLNQYPTAPLTDGAGITFIVGQGFGATAIGYQAGSSFQDDNAVAVGRQAGYSSQSKRAVAVGGLAGYSSQSANSVAVGYSAGYTGQGTAAVAIGAGAGYTNQGNNSIIINATAATLDQTTANAFTVAPVRNDVANTANVMFYNATSKEITYGNVISVAGNITSGNISTGVIRLTNGADIKDTANNAVAFGKQAGSTSQGSHAVAIGRGAGLQGQGNFSVAIGYLAGNNTQGGDSVAVGVNSGGQGQGSEAVAVGSYAGYTSQGNLSVAVGRGAGENSQGANSVAVGHLAGRTNQGNNSIILNATGANLEQTTANTFTVKPVRGDSTSNLVSGGFKAVYYNSTTGEFAYSTD